MLFNSLEFFIFLPAVFIFYWFLAGHSAKLQNSFLLIASYFFYGWWDWRFLFLIAFSSLVDYLIGTQIYNSKCLSKRKFFLLISIFVNIGFLAFFKYFNFFIQSFTDAFSFFGHPISDPILLNIILPIGISFYTFQTLSYTIDIYNKRLEPTKDLIAFFSFVSFFPQLVAGPIERAKNLLPQFHVKREFSYLLASDGMRQILWGLFKKIVIADNCAIYVNDIFSNHTDYSGSTLLLGATLFAFQIYGDFSGYSDIAIGTSKLFGFNLKRNFAFPYFSRDIAEFWRRWHISLTTWFRDYIYIPLGGSRAGPLINIRNILIIFIVSGFWHGANWTFIAWGMLNALYFIPLMLMGKNKQHVDVIQENSTLPNLIDVIKIGTTFLMVVIAWVFFRAESLNHALSYLSTIFSISLFSSPEIWPKKILWLILLMTAIEWAQRDKLHALELTKLSNTAARWSIYYGLIFLIWQYGASQQEFIYFQF